jgi:hypothetical protein
MPPAGSSPRTVPDPIRATSDPTRTGRRALFGRLTGSSACWPSWGAPGLIASVACILIQAIVSWERTHMPPTGSSWIARRWHLYPQLYAARGPSSWRRNQSPVTVPRASGENPGQDDPDAAGVLDLDSGPEMGTSPGSSNGPEPGRRPCPGTPWRRRPPRPRSPGRRRIRLPGASILYLGITLSDER